MIRAEVRSSADYSIVTDVTDSIGGPSISAIYSNEGSAGGIVGTANVTSPQQVDTAGYIGQLGDETVGPSLLVTNTNNSGPGSLRAIIASAPRPGPSTITFAPELSGQVINLTGSPIDIDYDRNVTIDASALPGGLTISGDNVDSSVFYVAYSAVTLRSLSITGGAGYQGGAIENNRGDLTLDRVTISGNHATYSGGAVYSVGQTGDGSLTIRNSSLSGNTADSFGGALFCSGDFPVTIVNSTLSGNQANYGGGIYSSFSQLTMTHCTVAGNSAIFPGGIYCSRGALTLENNIVAANTGTSSDNDIYFSTGQSRPILTLIGANLIGDNSSVAAEFPVGPLVGTTANPLDPLLSPLSSYGGRTLTRALLAGSPAINAASASSRISDQRGFPLNGLPDIGAFELQAAEVPAISRLPDQFINQYTTSLVLPFTVGDADTPAGSLVVGRNSSNTALLPLANVVLGGSGSARTVTLTPVPGVSGTSTLTLTVTDGTTVASTAFQLTVEFISPEMRVGPDAERVIANGDLTPDPNGGTDFGSSLEGPVTYNIFIFNNGTEDLSLTGTPKIAISGPGAAGFTVTREPDAVVPAGGLTFFNLTFEASTFGFHDAVVTIANNDPDDDPYVFAVTGSHGQPGDLDSLNANFASNSYVVTTALQPDGKMLVAGYFSSVGGYTRNHLVRLNTDGTVDATFNPNPDGDVNCVVVQDDGKIVVGGWFNTIGGQARNYIARLNADGTVDSTFDPNAGYAVNCLALQPDGKILLGGEFDTLQPNGAATATARHRIARVNADGSLDTSFDPNPSNSVNCLLLQPNGKIVLGGGFTTLQPNGAATQTTRNFIARVNADGTLDTTFDPNANNGVRSLALQPDGKIVLGGLFTTLQPNGAASVTPRDYIARVNVDGSLDTSFDPNGAREFPISSITALAFQADGDLLFGGQSHLARANADGSLDPTFGIRVSGHIWDVAIQSNGLVLIAGGFNSIRPPSSSTGFISHPGFARLLNDDASQILSVQDATQILWSSGGTAPVFNSVTFELSIDGGSTWSALGAGVRVVGTSPNWQLTGLSLPSSGHLRGRGRAVGGSSGLIEQVAAFSGLAPPPPTVTQSTANLASNATTLTITGTGFDATTPSNNTVVFTPSGSGTVTASTTTSLTVTGITGLTAGSLNAVVTTDGQSRGTAVQVATVVPPPTVTLSTVNLASSATTLTITGTGFSTTPSNNTVVFTPSGSGTVTASTATSLTVTGITGLTGGALNAVVTSNGASSGAAIQVATVIPAPTVTLSTANLASNATTLTITGTEFSPTPGNNTVAFSPAGSGTVTASTTTSLTVTSITGLAVGVLNAVITTDGQSSGSAVQVGTVVVLTPLETWRQNYFGFPANSGNGLDSLDYENDGIPNLIEFALGGNPLLPDTGLLPEAQLIGGNLVLTVTQPGGVSGITYGAEWSTTLLPGSWTPITDTGILPFHTFSVPRGTNHKLFIRLRVSNP
jgi:uncharacterized delta-60 repeat protein